MWIWELINTISKQHVAAAYRHFVTITDYPDPSVTRSLRHHLRHRSPVRLEARSRDQGQDPRRYDQALARKKIKITL